MRMCEYMIIWSLPVTQMPGVRFPDEEYITHSVRIYILVIIIIITTASHAYIIFVYIMAEWFKALD